MNFSLTNLTCVVVLSLLILVTPKAKDVFENRALVPFFLQDPNDGLCLSMQGFTSCDTSTLWVMAGRKEGASFINLLHPDSNKFCLEREKGGKVGGNVVGGSCRNKGAKEWLLQGPNSAGYYKVTEKTEQLCLTRYKGGGTKGAKGGKGRIRTSSTLQKCVEKNAKKNNSKKNSKKNSESGYLQLDIIETAVHDTGFFLESADNKCFDGSKFVNCDGSTSVLWGIGFNFDSKGNAHRTFFKVGNPDLCLVASGGSDVKLGDCKSKAARDWGLADGRLSYSNEKYCLARTVTNVGAIRKCSEYFEHLTLSIPREADEALKRRKEAEQLLIASQQHQLQSEQLQRDAYQKKQLKAGYYDL